jgi:predicted ATPase
MSSIGHSKQVASLSWRGAALDVVLTRYSGETRVGRIEYVFRFDRDDTLTVAYLTGFSAHEIANNDSYLSITSVYQRSVP